jgi:ABC-type nitrate/sulfonate/bicarbonate transport system substrate-binding protein
VVRREAASGNARTILDLTDLADRTAIYGYSASRAMRETRGEDLRAFMSAVHRAAAHMQNDRAWSLRFLRTFANITDSGLAESLFDQVVNRLSTKGVSDPEEVRRGLSLAARAWNDPMLADIDPELVYSNEFLSPDL